MSQPTPGAKVCGCHMDIVADDEKEPCDLCSEGTGMNDGVGWTISYCALHAQAEITKTQHTAMKDLLQQIADAPCDHGEQPFCPRNEAYRLLKTIKGA